MEDASRRTAEAGLVSEALKSCRPAPLPNDCRTMEWPQVQVGDRLDFALVRTYQALSVANARIKRCAEWADGVR